VDFSAIETTSLPKTLNNMDIIEIIVIIKHITVHILFLYIGYNVAKIKMSEIAGIIIELREFPSIIMAYSTISDIADT
jgi:hypothetical protein